MPLKGSAIPNKNPGVVQLQLFCTGEVVSFYQVLDKGRRAETLERPRDGTLDFPRVSAYPLKMFKNECIWGGSSPGQGPYLQASSRVQTVIPFDEGYATRYSCGRDWID